MTALHDLQQRIFIGDVIDDSGSLQQLKVALEERVWEDESIEPLDEYYELNGEYVTLFELLIQFGESKMDAFMADATQNAR